VSWKSLRWCALPPAAWFLLPRLGAAGTVLAVLMIVTGLALLAYRFHRWFPLRATRELNKIIHLNRIIRSEDRVKLRWVRKRGRVYELAWKVPTGITVGALTRMSEVMEQAVDCSAEFWYDRGRIWMRAGTGRLPKRVEFEHFYRERRPAGELVIGMGVSRAGWEWYDLARIPHLLVGGTPGSGKSVFLRQVITGLVLEHGPESLQLVLIDLKGGMEFRLFRDLPHLLVPIVSDVPQCGPALELVLAELDRRQALFAETGVEKLSRWNELHPDAPLPYILVAVDEFGEVSAVEPQEGGGRARARASLAPFSRLARLGRASGIHLVLCTQRPDADVMPGQIKDQIPATVAFRTRSAVNSHILLGDRNESAALLPPWPGRAVCQWEREAEMQAPDLDIATAEALLWARYPLGLAEGTDRVTQCPLRSQEGESESEEAA
jgi:hypothetical protein